MHWRAKAFKRTAFSFWTTKPIIRKLNSGIQVWWLSKRSFYSVRKLKTRVKIQKLNNFPAKTKFLNVKKSNPESNWKISIGKLLVKKRFSNLIVGKERTFGAFSSPKNAKLEEKLGNSDFWNEFWANEGLKSRIRTTFLRKERKTRRNAEKTTKKWKNDASYH